MKRLVFGLAVLCMLACGNSCLRAAASDLLRELDAADLALVETGNIGKTRWLRFAGSGGFDEVRTDGNSYIGGVTREGNGVIVNTSVEAHLRRYPAQDQVDIVSLDSGKVIKSFAPDTPGINLLDAEVSSDLNSLALVGTLGPRAYGLYFVTPDGRARRLVSTAETEMPRSIGMSPDASRIVYDSGGQILIYDVASDAPRPLTLGDYPSWSPDGQWIAYRGPDERAHLISPDGSSTKLLLGETAIAAGLRWSPDGKYILYTAKYRGAISVVRLSDGQTATIYTSFMGQNESRLRWVKGAHQWPGQVRK